MGLGAARALPKPVSPRALQEAVLHGARVTAHEPLAEPIGEATVDELGRPHR